MTIENLKQIAIKYATTKGSRVPLAPDELCNAVVQYFNEFLKITADINTIQVAVTEEGGNIVFTITGNTLDGKAFTPIVITVDHNDFVTNQEFEEFKTSVTEQLNNKLNKITSPVSNFVLYANIEGNDTQINYTSGPVTNSILYRDETGKTAVVKGVSGQDVANMENLSDITAKIPDTTNFADVTKANTFAEINTFNKRAYFKEIHFEDNDYNIYNTYANNQGIYSKYVADVSENIYNIKELGIYYYCLGTVTNDGMFHEFLFPNEGGTLALTSDIPAIPEYTSVDSVIYDTTNGAIIAYNGAGEIHIPLLAGENVTIDASEDNKKIVISAAGGGGTGDVTAAGNNTFTGENTFTNEITFNTMKSEAGGIQFGNFEFIMENGYTYSGLNDYQFVMQKFVGTDDYYETLINADLITYKPAGNNNVYEFHFPNKSGTFAMTTDVIKDPIYFISFYANDPSNACHLIGTMMSKNSYGTGQKTNDEFAVMLADNLYTNSNEGLAAYGKLAEKDILCIYSEDGLSIRCLDETNSEVDLPTVMFFVMETEL